MPDDATSEERLTIVTQQAEDFDAAFNEAATASEKDVEQVVKTEDGTPKEDEQKPTEKDAKEEEKETKASDDAPAKEEKDKDKDIEHQYKSLQGMYNQLQKELKELKEAKKEEPVEPKKPSKPDKEPEDLSKLLQGFNDTLFTDLDDVAKKAIKEYDEEFDQISKVEDVKRQHALKMVVELVEKRQDDKIASFAKALKDVIQPLFDSIEQTSQSTHYEKIKAAHGDFETYRDNGQLMSWIEAQPKFLKDSYMKVYKNGDTQDVIDMYTRFKTEKGLSETSGNGDGKKKSSDDRMKNLETVKSKTSGVNIGSTGRADDFDSAFDEALAKTARR